jgi:hypothetical protein
LPIDLVMPRDCAARFKTDFASGRRDNSGGAGKRCSKSDGAIDRTSTNSTPSGERNTNAAARTGSTAVESGTRGNLAANAFACWCSHVCHSTGCHRSARQIHSGRGS